MSLHCSSFTSGMSTCWTARIMSITGTVSRLRTAMGSLVNPGVRSVMAASHRQGSSRRVHRYTRSLPATAAGKSGSSRHSTFDESWLIEYRSEDFGRAVAFCALAVGIREGGWRRPAVAGLMLAAASESHVVPVALVVIALCAGGGRNCCAPESQGPASDSTRCRCAGRDRRARPAFIRFSRVGRSDSAEPPARAATAPSTPL